MSAQPSLIPFFSGPRHTGRFAVMADSILSRLVDRLRGSASTVSASVDPPNTETVRLAQQKLSRALEARSNSQNQRRIVGPGAERVRAAQAIIKRLARRAPGTGGIPASVGQRSAVVQDRDGKSLVIKAPAVFSVAGQLKS